jgi:HK97 gp10 family phage protein
VGSSFTMTLDLAAANAEIEAVGTKAAGKMRPAAQAAAQVLYDEVMLRVPVAKRAKTLKSGRVIKPGALRAAIYQAYSEDHSTAARATYHVSWNAKKAPHGHLVENGTSRAPAHPFLRPAWDNKLQTAIDAANAKFQTEMGGAQ